MTITYEAETGTCPSGCKNGWVACPHTEIDAEGWCTECDTPADEINPRVCCQDSWHD